MGIPGRHRDHGELGPRSWLMSLANDACKVFRQVLPPVETSLLNLHDRCSRFTEIGLSSGGDQVTKVSQVLVAARENLQRDQVPDRCHRHEDIQQYLQPVSSLDDFVLDTGVREEKIDKSTSLVNRGSARNATAKPPMTAHRAPIASRSAAACLRTATDCIPDYLRAGSRRRSPASPLGMRSHACT
jgi:hypothetical protein